MKYDRNKSFPYPVLSDYSDDYINAAFQASQYLYVDSETGDVVLDVQFMLSEKAIDALVQQGKATYAVLVKCSKTYYRECFFSEGTELEVQIESGVLHGKVELSPYIIATSNLQGFTSPQFNSEYNQAYFDLPAGAVLALNEPDTYYVDQEDLKNIGSVLLLNGTEDQEQGFVSYSIDEDMISIDVSIFDKKRIDAARNETKLKGFILMGIIMPVIAEIIMILTKPDQRETYEDRKWYRALELRLQELSIDIDSITSPLEVAQKIFDYPLQQLHLTEENI